VPVKKIKDALLPQGNYAHVFFILCGLLILSISIISSFFPVDNYDIWWHLQTGKQILSERAVPDSDFYSFTASGNRWITHEWLAEIIFYLIYALGGINLLITFKVLTAAFISFIILLYFYKSDNKNPLILILLTAAVCIGSFRLFERPHLFTYLFLAILCLNVFSPGYFNAGRRVRLLLIPALFFIWANIHSGFVIGLGVYWIISIGAFIENRIRGSSAEVTLKGYVSKFVVPPAVSTLAALINPNGFRAFQYPFLLASEPVFKSAIAEMVSSFEIFPTERLYWMLLLVLIGFAVFGAVINIKKRPALSLILLIGIVSGLVSVRNSYEFALITAAAAIVTFPPMPRRLFKAGTGAAICFIIFFGYHTIGHIRDIRGLGFGIKEELPHEAADFLKKIAYRGNIYAPLGWGSYLIWRVWPEVKVFIDGRLDVYGPELLNEYHYIRQDEPGALDRLENYGTDAVAVPIGQQRWRIREAVDASANWQLCYFDDKSVVFLRINSHNEGWLRDWGYSKIDPLAPGYLRSTAQRADTAAILTEALRARDLSPGSVTTNAVLARACFLNSKFISAADYYKEAFFLGPRMTDFLYQVATSYNRGGEFDSAAAWYELAIGANPRQEESYFEYGAMEAGRGDYNKAIAIWKSVLEFDPQSRAAAFIGEAKRLMAASKPDSG
jgi:hypothetical protein